MTNTVKPYQSECQTWEQVLPLFKVGTIYKYTPKYAQHVKKDNEEGFNTETGFFLTSPKFVGLFKLTAITGEGKYQSDFEFRSLEGKIVFPNHRFIQVATDVYEEKDLNLMADLAAVGF